MKRILMVILFAGCMLPAWSQNLLGGHVTGNFQTDLQYSKEDTLIGSAKIQEHVLSNTYANFLYTLGDFSAGVRFEAYLNPILGFPAQYKGAGVPFRFASYKKDFIELTVGNFYEQFGSGMVFRSYQEPNLGVDNAMDGIKILSRPADGVVLKGILGKQRYYWTDVWTGGDFGLVRGIDGEFHLNELLPMMNKATTQVIVGGSFVSKYEPQTTQTVNMGGSAYKLNFPENVGSGAARLLITDGKWNFNAEYAYKGQDPSAMNNYIYRHGEALQISAGYTRKGLGVNVTAKRIDNMSYKSRRNEVGNMLNINYLPALTKQHTYSLLTLYPYATQMNGEMGIQADVIYKIPKGTWLGGKYGTDVKLNYARIHGLNYKQIENKPLFAQGTRGYESDFFKIGEDLYHEDLNIEIGKKLTKAFKFTFTYAHQIFNPIAIGHKGDPFVYANVFILDGLYKISGKQSLRGELQWLQTKQNYGEWATGNWAMALLEYNLGGHWFFALADRWNYGNDDAAGRTHYYNIALGYTRGTGRIQLSYGKQRQGVMCIGGVCREVPASNGVFVTLSSSF